jgi:uncharacterized protein
LAFDREKFNSLQALWLEKPLTDDDLLTLGKGWLSTSTPSSSNTANGVKILKQLARKGSARANLTLGLWGENPELRPIVGEPETYLLNAANAGDALAQQAYGRSRLRPGWADYDAPLGIDWLSKSVKGGNVAAKSDLGFAYEFGIGTKPDIAKSEQLFSEAAATGQPRLLFSYAQFKVRNGASFSDELVAQLLNRAAAEGEPAAQFVLADRALTKDIRSIYCERRSDAHVPSPRR